MRSEGAWSWVGMAAAKSGTVLVVSLGNSIHALLYNLSHNIMYVLYYHHFTIN